MARVFASPVFARGALQSGSPTSSSLPLRDLVNASIDVAAAGERGIAVVHTGYSSDPTIEFTWALILAAARHIVTESNSVRSGGWQHTVGTDLRGKTLGVLGLGRIGSQVARVGSALGMNLIAWSQNMTPEAGKAAGAILVSKDQLFERADTLTIHLVLSSRTRGLVPGHEFSGVVEQIGSDVAAYAPGDAVFGISGMGGGYAEYLTVKPATIARKPSNLSLEEAASVPVASETAWQGIFTHGHLEKGQTILIHGGAGAVGAYAVQLASHTGATVIATASGDNEAYLNSIGTGRVIDYREEQFEKVLRAKVDVVFDLIGGDTQKRSFLVLREGGHLVAATQPVSQEETARHRVSGAMMRLAPSADVLGRIARLLEEGTIRPDVATVYALQDAAQAWKDIAGNLPGVHGISASGPGAARRRSHGKIVLRVA